MLKNKTNKTTHTQNTNPQKPKTSTNKKQTNNPNVFEERKKCEICVRYCQLG